MSPRAGHHRLLDQEVAPDRGVPLAVQTDLLECLGEFSRGELNLGGVVIWPLVARRVLDGFGAVSEAGGGAKDQRAVVGLLDAEPRGVLDPVVGSAARLEVRGICRAGSVARD